MLGMLLLLPESRDPITQHPLSTNSVTPDRTNALFYIQIPPTPLICYTMRDMTLPSSRLPLGAPSFLRRFKVPFRFSLPGVRGWLPLILWRRACWLITSLVFVSRMVC